MDARWASLLIALTLAASGCRAPSYLVRLAPVSQEELNRALAEPLVTTCFTAEFGADSAEVTKRRERRYRGVGFRYLPAAEIPAAIAERGPAPAHIALIAHGWLNDDLGARQFTSAVARGLFDAARRDELAPEALAFVGLHWDSARMLFHESAATAEVIGRERVAPLVEALRRAFPAATITLVGHSLGARLVLATLHRADPAQADAAVLLEAAVDVDALHRTAGFLGFGFFPGAPRAARLIANVHSMQDDVLERAYRPAMGTAAMGREGAERAPGLRYPSVYLGKITVDPAALHVALADPDARAPGAPARVVNVDASSLIPGHVAVDHPAVHELTWRIARLARDDAASRRAR